MCQVINSSISSEKPFKDVRSSYFIEKIWQKVSTAAIRKNTEDFLLEIQQCKSIQGCQIWYGPSSQRFFKTFFFVYM